MARTKKILTEDLLLLAYNIREGRTRKFDTINEAAVSFKVEKSLWRQWENAVVAPQKSMLQKAADFLGIPVQSLHKKPDEWERIKVEFMQELIGRTKVNKDYYLPLYQSFKKSPQHPGGGEQTTKGHKHDDAELLSIFLQITRLITDARNKAHEVDQETYDMHMQTIADMAKLSLLVNK